MSLTKFANRYGTDKGTTAGNAHAYSCVYDALFSFMRDRPINLMEIGLAIGGPELGQNPDRQVTDVPSLRMWHEYFPHAHIFGVDISDFCRFEADYFTFFRADCGDGDALARIANSVPSCDIIIDDGSHASYHQQLTLTHLFPLVKSGGFYIVEDLDWQPPVYERQLPRVPKTADLLSDFMETGRLTGSICLEKWPALNMEKQISGVFLYTAESLDKFGRLFNLLSGDHHAVSRYEPAIFGSKKQASAILRSTRRLFRAIAAQPERPGRIKLAVIQKA